MPVLGLIFGHTPEAVLISFEAFLTGLVLGAFLMAALLLVSRGEFK